MVLASTNAIVAENLQKNFASVRAVDDISIEVKEGEIFGFLGPNGAGKTTFIRMVTGILKPSSGSIKIFGRNVWENLLSVKQIISTVPEMANVYVDLTGWDNLELIGRLYGIPRKRRHERAARLLREFDLYEKRMVKTKKYSKGMKQRLLLCTALIHEPKVLFLDEPTSGLDVNSARMIKRLLKQYNKHKGITIFLTTHNMQVAEDLCDRIAIIKQGKIIRLDTTENLCKLEQQYRAIDVEIDKEISIIDPAELQPYVTKVENRGTFYRFHMDYFHEGVQSVINYLNAKHARITGITTREPSLEEIFVGLVNGGTMDDS